MIWAYRLEAAGKPKIVNATSIFKYYMCENKPEVSLLLEIFFFTIVAYKQMVLLYLQAMLSDLRWL